MPLLKGKAQIGHNVEEEESAGKSKAQAAAIALKTAGAPKARDSTVTMPSGGIPVAAEDGSFSFGDVWPSR